MRSLRVDIDEYTEGIFKYFHHRKQALEVSLSSLLRCPEFQLDDGMISLLAATVPGRIERFVNDQIGPNLQAMRVKPLLIFLFEDRTLREQFPELRSFQLGPQLPLKAAFGLEESRLVNGGQCLAEASQ